MRNNTISDNTADYDGGGLACHETTTPSVNNSILWSNNAPNGPEIWIGDTSKPATLSISYSDVEGGQSSVYVDSGCTLNWGPAMIDQDPLFENPANDDYHLAWTSPCINRGTDDGAPGDDIDGDPRPFMGTTDMGADEYTGPHTLEADSFELPEMTGGTVNMSLDAGPGNGNRWYVVLGAISGTNPGVPLPQNKAILPLNWDAFTNGMINNLNSIFYQNFLGQLDGLGQAMATLNLGPAPGTGGLLVLSFAYTLGNPFNFVSNPVNIKMVQ
jgi:hypothetical protein